MLLILFRVSDIRRLSRKASSAAGPPTLAISPSTSHVQSLCDYGDQVALCAMKTLRTCTRSSRTHQAFPLAQALHKLRIGVVQREYLLHLRS